MAKYIKKDYVYEMFPIREETANKGSFGRILNISGSDRYIGAAYLSSVSALKTGAGFVMLACPEKIVPAIVSMAPEITFLPLKDSSIDELSTEMEIADIISIGCGLTTQDNIKKLVIDVLKNRKKEQKIIVDADGINALSTANCEISLSNGIITPHPKELSRLLNVQTEDILENREKYARIASKKYDCITVLKGHETIVTDGDTIYINTTGNSALAKAGSGDVLTGIIAGLLSQDADILDAALMGVYLHGLSGDIASEDLTQYSVLASDTIEYIPFAIKDILSDD